MNWTASGASPLVGVPLKAAVGPSAGGGPPDVVTMSCGLVAPSRLE